MFKKNPLQTTLKVKSTSKIAIVVGTYYPEITEKLLSSCQAELKKYGVLSRNIEVYETFGAYEIPYVCAKLLNKKKLDAIITLGCIIKGETAHFDFIASAVTQGIIELNLKGITPIILGILTPNNLKQAKARSGKGAEAAQAALKLISTKI